MNSSTFNVLKKLPTAALASVIVFGTAASSLPFAPHVSAAESSAAAVAAPDLSSSEKKELIALVNASIDSQLEFSQTSDHFEYWTLSEAQNQALKVLANPNPTSAQLSSALRKLESARWTYDYRYIDNKSEASRSASKLAQYITHGEPRETLNLTAEQNAILDFLDQFFAYLNGVGESKEEAVRAYEYYRLGLAKLPSLAPVDLAPYRSSLTEYRARIVAPLASLAQLNVNVDKRVSDFERSAQFLQTLLDNGPYDRSVYQAARHDVEIYRNIIIDSEELARAIARAEQLLDSPKGVQPGQYPASSFGTLNRAINHAQRVLETAGSAEELDYEASFVLERAMNVFKNSVKK
ncbi:hypothetical protein QWJ34_06705 [Saccharibacillus sp. CPCC 101409]|uniref:hypothetical protein n=1 Tax=Saccharibacillus sp. CPCC 101409 TaxID=3058041 RepID=UPI002671E25D|nr:hypothetical protein [Saccharibacillus sp. CPCC 101409]MDO3409447.1 hypothetical protein [Saccharibacillus sp. CPCC 101409]